ncbi:antitoxin [Massilia sp. B-10]|nr:antitoxin [Massilia sp. B-10]UUZ52966.1 antitoxin [Massilia sp. H-1]
MAIAKIFMSGRSQAVRLPKEFRLSGDQVSVSRVGRSLVLTPIEPQWSDFFGLLAEFDTDFPIERDQPETEQDRPSLDDQ